MPKPKAQTPQAGADARPEWVPAGRAWMTTGPARTFNQREPLTAS